MLRLSNRLILLISILVLTGCSAKYELTINNDQNLNESLNITENDTSKFNEKIIQLKNSTPKEYLETNLDWPTPAYINTEENPIEPKKIDGIDYYDKKDISSELSLGINYNFKHKQDNFSKSNILNNCYEYNYLSENNTIKFETTSEFKCFATYELLDDVEFALNTKCKVVNNNADKKTNNKYTWKINKKHPEKSIRFNLDCSREKHKEKEFPVVLLVPIYFVLIGIGVLLLHTLYLYNNRI